METFIILIILIFGILQLIPFFEIWGMINDIRGIKERYLPSTTSPKEKVPTQPTEFDTGELVVKIKTGKQIRIKEITEDGKYSCYTGGDASHEGDSTVSEIKHFNS